MLRFHRIYWLDKFNWAAYAKNYQSYVRSRENYYSLSARALIRAVKITPNMRVADLGCGTGALTRELLAVYPLLKIVAIDIGAETLKYYRQNFFRQIKRGQIQVYEGNAEDAQCFLKEPLDIVFVASALWDMDLPRLFKNLPRFLKPSGKLVANMSAWTLGVKRGLIYAIEKFFRQEADVTRGYRQCPISVLNKILRQNHFKIQARKKYQFWLSREKCQRFFRLLSYRYPFIFFSDQRPSAERYEQCRAIFRRLVDKLPAKGLREEGEIITIGF